MTLALFKSSCWLTIMPNPATATKDTNTNRICQLLQPAL